MQFDQGHVFMTPPLISRPPQQLFVTGFISMAPSGVAVHPMQLPPPLLPLPQQQFSPAQQTSLLIPPPQMPPHATQVQRQVSGVVVPAAAASATAVTTSDVKLWLEAAQNFELNDDFDIREEVAAARMDLPGLMAVMKRESNEKGTIQLLADKHLLHQVLSNLRIPQLPELLTIDGSSNVKEEIRSFMEEHAAEDGSDIILKPTHLSNASGVLIIRNVQEHQFDDTVSFMTRHVEQFMSQQAGAHESLALQSLRPGFVVQPRYQSVIEFSAPLEVRVVSLWGKVRLGLWWWGRTAGAPGEAPNRNAWIIRRPATAGSLSDDDRWEVIHEHQGSNPGFEIALKLFEHHMPGMAAATETIATAFGAPFLRADFFLGSADWGVRLNEVAYGCGVDYRTRTSCTGRLLDDAPNIAHILQEGMMLCHVKPARHFLSRVGVKGRSYEEMTVARPPRPLRGSWLRPTKVMQAAAQDENAEAWAVPEEMCRTVRPSCLLLAPPAPVRQVTAALVQQPQHICISQQPPCSPCIQSSHRAILSARWSPNCVTPTGGSGNWTPGRPRAAGVGTPLYMAVGPTKLTYF
jgi:hypothetical protein